VVISKASPTISTTASSAITVGNTVSDQANLSNGFNATGMITFNLYGPNDPMCGNNPVFTSTVSVNGDGSYASGPFTPTSPGTYNWVASYSGDANNNTASGNCGDKGESVGVSKATPTISTGASPATTLGHSISDNATVSAGFNPTGTVTFMLYGPNDPMCGNAPIFTSTGTISNLRVASSGSFTPTSPGTYNWVATYNGDNNNNSVSGNCGDESESVAVSKATPVVTTTASADTTLGNSVSDTATVSGGFHPAGTVTFRLFGPNDMTCVLPPIFTVTKTLDGGGHASSGSFTPALPGTYLFVATYNGDSNNFSTSLDSGDETVVVSGVEADGNGSVGQVTFSFTDEMPGKKGPKFLNYSDPSCPVSFSTTKISPLTIMGNHASFTGTAKAGRRSTISFTVQVDENGPGSMDHFSITLSNGCSRSGNLTSGNIAFH
jgi:hypothetical protein